MTSYFRNNGGATYNNRFQWARQSFVAKSNVITRLGATVGAGSGDQSRYQLRFILTTVADCSGTGQIGSGSGSVVNYGITTADIGDVRVVPGITYYYCWFSPQYPDFITYWWASSGLGSNALINPLITGFQTSNEFAGIVEGYWK